MDRVREFLSACAHDDVPSIRAMLDAGLDVDAADEDDVTGLQTAAANGAGAVARELVVRGAALDKANSCGWTPLLHAARHGHAGVAAFLLQNQADVKARTDLGVNAMTLAAHGGHLAVCRLLRDTGIELTLLSGSAVGPGVTRSACELTPIIAAAHRGHDAVVCELLDGQRGGSGGTRGGRAYEGDVNYQMPSLGVSALMLAALTGHVTTAQVLVERGTDADLTNINGHTALDIARLRAQREVQGYLERKTARHSTAYNDDKPDIIETTKLGDVDKVRDILVADVTQRDTASVSDGATPLMYAAIAGRLDLARLLVEAGCDINKKDTVNGWTALLQAIFHGHKEVATYLIEAGADVLIPAKNGRTALEMLTHLDDIDTELYRLLAAHSVQTEAPAAPPAPLVTSTGGMQGPFAPPILLDQTAGAKLAPNRGGSVPGAGGGVSKTVQFHSPSPGGSRRGGESPTSSRTDVNETGETGDENQPKTNLKAWWSRMSNRFRNLKLGRTFYLSQLGPMPSEEKEEEEGVGEAEGGTPLGRQEQAVINGDVANKKPDSLSSNSSTRSFIPSSLTPRPREPSRSTKRLDLIANDPTDHSSRICDLTLSSANKSGSIYNLINAGQTNPRPLGPTVNQSIVPPFQPPPTFHLDRSKMPPVGGLRKSISSLGSSPALAFSPPIGSTSARLLQSQSTLSLAAHHSRIVPLTSRLQLTSTANRGSSIPVTTPPGAFLSPSFDVTLSRGVRIQLDGTKSPKDSTIRFLSNGTHESKPLRLGENNDSAKPIDVNSAQLRLATSIVEPPPAPPQAPRGALGGPSHRSAEVSPSASSEASVLSSVISSETSRLTSSSSTLTAGSQRDYTHRGVHKRSGARSKGSASTLTPSASPQPPHVATDEAVRPSTDFNLAPPGGDDMLTILQKLSLEKYRPIFEEQEVDMEAFLTLTDHDLVDLGIVQIESRRQIVAAISELGDSKDRERQQHQQTLLHFSATLRSRTSTDTDPANTSDFEDS